MLMPSRVKYRKSFRGKLRGVAQRANKLAFGEYGLQALQNTWITARQIEAGRVVLTRYTKKGGKLWVRLFPWKPVSKKPAETRMGKGKGDPEFWVDPVKRGRVIYEIEGIGLAEAQGAMKRVSDKLPIKCKFVKRLEY